MNKIFNFLTKFLIKIKSKIVKVMSIDVNEDTKMTFDVPGTL